MARDPVCGMDVNQNTAPAESDYQGQHYYFCGEGCKNEFERQPQQYV